MYEGDSEEELWARYNVSHQRFFEDPGDYFSMLEIHIFYLIINLENPS